MACSGYLTDHRSHLIAQTDILCLWERRQTLLTLREMALQHVRVSQTHKRKPVLQNSNFKQFLQTNLASQTYPDTCEPNVVAPKSQENVNLSNGNMSHTVSATSIVSAILKLDP